MTKLLQNHPGRRELPLRPGRVSRNLTTTQTRNTGLTVISVAMLVLVIATASGFGGLLPGPLRVVALVLVFTAFFWFVFQWQTRRPLRHQTRYYTAAGIGEPSERERRALRIGASRDYVRGWWPLTIEPYPVADRISNDLVETLDTLRFDSRQLTADVLAKNWRILHAVGARQVIDDVLARGVRSQSFAREAGRSSVSDWDDLAAVSGVSLPELMDSTRSIDGRPPTLLWGSDLLEAHTLVRQATLVGYLTPEEGLDLLERITEYVALIFSDEQSFLRSVAIGLAVTNGPEGMGMIREWRALMDGYLASDWPTQLAPWPTPSGTVELPPVMATGFGRAS